MGTIHASLKDILKPEVHKMLKKLNHHLRVRAIVLTGVVCVFAVWTPPALAQEKTEAKEAKVEEVEPAPTGDPNAAKTTKELDIPVDELRVLIKPLTLKELQNEAAGWMGILQAKAKEISEAEVAIKRQNLAITKQQEGAKALDDAKKALEEAEQAQKSATPGSPEYEEAAKKVEEAKTNLKKAQESVEEAQTTKQELKEDKTLQEALAKAERSGNLDKVKEILDKTKQDRDKMKAGSPDYEQATKKIEKIEGSVKSYEDALKAKRVAKPNSPEHKEASEKLEKENEALKRLLQELGAGTTEQKQSSQQFNQAKATLENTEIINNGDEKKVAGSPGVVNEQQNLQQKQQQIERTTQQLEKSSEAESEAKNQLVAVVTRLQTQQTAIIDRFNVILDELERKGGKADAYRQYIQAVSSIELDAKDTEGLGVRLLGWAKSDEGGMRWANNTGKFLGVFVTSVIVAQILGTLLNLLLSKVGGTSVLMRQFIVMVIKRGGIVLGFLLALTALEVSLGPILALLGGVSFVLAFALQSNLGNLASGLMIMAYKPFDVGDEIKVGGLWGWVDSITLANTKIKGFNGAIFNVPNNAVWGETIENLTCSETRKIQVKLRVGFDEDLKKIEQLLLEIAKSHPQVLETPAPTTFVPTIGDYYINLSLNAWAKTKEYWKANADLIRMIQERFNQEGLNIAAIPKQIEIIEYSNGNGKSQIPHLASEMTVPRKVETVSTIRYEDDVDEVDVMDAEGAEAR
jgi:small conductance mechanosensitive channel